LPLIGLHVDLQGHTIRAVAVLMPVVGVGLGLMIAVLRIVMVARAVEQMLRADRLGAGPNESVIVGGPDVVVAEAGLMHPAIVVTAGALATLDDDELAAGLAHERGHVVITCCSRTRSATTPPPGCSRVRECCDGAPVPARARCR
jgi:hypothetical protein